MCNDKGLPLLMRSQPSLAVDAWWKAASAKMMFFTMAWPELSEGETKGKFVSVLLGRLCLREKQEQTDVTETWFFVESSVWFFCYAWHSTFWMRYSFLLLAREERRNAQSTNAGMSSALPDIFEDVDITQGDLPNEVCYLLFFIYACWLYV